MSRDNYQNNYWEEKMKATMCVLILLLSLFGLVNTSCTSKITPSQDDIVATMVVETLSAPRIDYIIINKESGQSAKCIIDVRLHKRISEDDVNMLAKHIKGK